VLSIANVVKLLGIKGTGKLTDTVIKGYAIDSRNVKKDHLFFAIKGERTDGHLYLDEVYKSGAVGCVVDRRFKNIQHARSILGEKKTAALKEYKNILFVDDTIVALQTLAQSIASKKTATTVAITGSCGKTTVKGLLVQALAKKFKVGCNQGNLNNQLGAPLSLLNADWDNDMYVAEIGASRRGDIAELCSFIQPDLGIITNVSPAHLQGFGSLEGVYETKTELGAYLVAHGGTIIADADDERLIEILDHMKVNTVTFGIQRIADFKATILKEDDEHVIVLINREAEVKINKFAVLNIKNALAVIAGAHVLGLQIDNIKDVFTAFSPQNGRFTFVRKGQVTVINDSYNANPASFANALELFTGVRHKGRKVLVCADMLELGDESDTLHRTIGRKIGKSPINVVVGIGHGGGLMIDECKAVNNSDRATYCVTDNKSALEVLKKEIRKDDMILFKASRGMRLEEIIERL
jgi:UDP-N-acetylmuramoyl-tripeptide--D-alanyl-D-alanine ligase